MSEENGLPHGWTRTTVGTVAESIQYGHTASAIDIPAGPRFLRITDIQEGAVDWKSVPSCAISPDEIGKYQLRMNDIVFARTGATTGKSFLIRDCPEAVFASYLIRLRMRPCVFPPFVQAFFQTNDYWRQIEVGKRGIGQPNVNAKTLASIELPVAPLDEQRRIVAKIEELFSDLDAAVAALKRAKANLKNYRAAVLKAAVEGKLTQEEPIQSFNSANCVEIGTLLTCIEQGWSPKCEREPATSPAEWAVMKTSAVLSMQFLETENKRLPDSLSPEPELEVQTDDLLITRAGPRNRAAVTCLVRSCRPRLIVCDKVYRMRCDRSKATPAFLEIVLNSPSILEELDDLKTGISDSGVNLTQQRFRRLMIPVPSLAVQERIVTEVERRISVTTATEIEITHSLLRAARLRQSILKQAFEGKLVPQDDNDEPAGVLLERLRTKHAEVQSTRNSTKRDNDTAPRRSPARAAAKLK